MDGPDSSVGRHQWLACAGIVIAAGLVWLSGERLLSALYAKYSRELARTGHVAHAYSAATHAQRLAPWRTEAYQAQLYAGAPSETSLVPVSAQALRWSPGDPYLWAELGRALIIEGSFGNPLAYALHNVDELAPKSPQLHRINTGFGLRYWHRGNPEVRRYWLKSMRFVLRTQPRRFLKYVKKKGQAERLCWIAEEELNLSKWCGIQLRH